MRKYGVPPCVTFEDDRASKRREVSAQVTKLLLNGVRIHTDLSAFYFSRKGGRFLQGTYLGL